VPAHPGQTTAAEARALSAKTLVDSVNDVERIVTIVNKPKTIVVPLPGRIARAILDGNEAVGVQARATQNKAKRREFILLTWLKPIRVLRATT